MVAGMSKPLILAVDADPTARAQLTLDLERYGDDFTIRVVDDLQEAAAMLEGPSRIALVLVDDSVGFDELLRFFDEHRDRLDDAARVMLCSVTDADEALEAINRVGVQHWVPRPWDDPLAGLYPVVDDLLDDWVADHPDSVRRVLLIGHRWARHSHDLKDFLGRNHVPFAWLDLDRGREAMATLHRLGATEAQLPVVVLPDGNVAADPSVEELAALLGMHAHADRRYYDLAIVGAGPAGLAAAVYGASEGLSTVLIERDAPGGQAGTSSRIENYLGFPSGVSGADLARRALTQAKRFGVEVLSPQHVERMTVAPPFKVLELGDGSSLSSKAVVVATGVTYRRLSAPGLDRLAGAGVYYGAATTEALDAAGEHVLVVGGANSAGQGAMYFSRFAERVTMIVRHDLASHMSQYLIDQIESTPNIEVRAGSHVLEAVGDDHLESVRIEDVEAGTVETVPTSFLFVFIGAEPSNPWLGDLVATDEHGYILAGPDLRHHEIESGWPLDRDPLHLETSLPGVFVAGDVRHGSIRRVAGAVGEGSTCVQLVHRYLANPE